MQTRSINRIIEMSLGIIAKSRKRLAEIKELEKTTELTEAHKKAMGRWGR